jgi:hypothetical protein
MNNPLPMDRSSPLFSAGGKGNCYLARLYETEIKSGGDYGDLQRTVVINILNESYLGVTQNYTFSSNNTLISPMS